MSHISLHSSQINNGDTFVALTGATYHGLDFAREAIKNGASKIISDIPSKAELSVPVVVDEHLANNLETLANQYYPNAKTRKIIAVTGTNGKTSVASFLSQMLEKLGVANQVIGTLTSELTTPDILTLYKKLEAFEGYTILEVSSHALVQKRTAGLEFEVAIWTNLTQDHLDYHKTMEAYGEAKLLICEQSRFGIFNEDDDFYPQFATKLPHNSYSLQQLQFKAKEFGFWCNFNDIIFELNLLGEFNLSNTLAAIHTLLYLGFEALPILQSVATLQNPLGRMQKVDEHTIFIDFAHTPDGLKNSLQTLRTHYPQHNITVVFGCGGNRDKDKRHKMGKVAETLAHRIILTNDNPRDENPDDIINDILLGINNPVQIIQDRALAIEAGISGIDASEIEEVRVRGVKKMQANECVLIAGKGGEQYQIIAGEKLPFNDATIVQNILE